MIAHREDVCTITAKGQTTVPKAIRQALGVDYGGRIAFRVDDRGVTLHRADVDQEDPAIDGFLSFLARDLAQHPDRIAALSPVLAARIATLVQGVDADGEIDGDVAL